MNNPIEDDEPLDPVMERVRVKMVRLLGISIGLMLLALITVLGAVVYKITQDSDNAEAEAVSPEQPAVVTTAGPLLEAIDLDLPVGASVISSQINVNRMMFDLRLNDGSRQFWVLDLQSGQVISKVVVQ